MFSRIAKRYDLANRLLSGGADVWWRWRLVRDVRRAAPSDVLDLATGSGDVAFALSRRLSATTAITGMDFCQPMLDEAEAKKARACSSNATLECGGRAKRRHRFGQIMPAVLPAPLKAVSPVANAPSATALQNSAPPLATRYANITFRQGDGMALPLPDACVDAVTISFGLRNMADRHRSLCEMRRVLREGGRVFVLEFSQPWRWFRPIYYFYLRHVLPAIAGIVTGDRAAYDYLNNTIERFPARAALEVELRAAGFSGVMSHGMTCGIVALHTGRK